MNQCSDYNEYENCEEYKKKKAKPIYETKVDNIELIESNDILIRVKRTDCIIRRDIEIKLKKFQRIYGCVYEKDNNPVKNLLVSLVKYEKVCGVLEREIVTYCTTDSLGYFNFLIPYDDTSIYKIELQDIIK